MYNCNKNIGDNMNKRGFTLVELLAVIGILALILVIVIPKVTDSLSSSKDKLYEDTKKEIEKTASQYVASHPEVIGDETFTISLETLCEDKYLNCPVIDPRDKSEMNGEISVELISNNMYEYTYID